MITRLRPPIRSRRWALLVVLAAVALGLTPTTVSADPADRAPAPSHVYNPYSGLCLTPENFSTEAGTRVVIYNCIQHRLQRWEHRADGTLYNPAARLCLNLYGQHTEPGTAIEIWHCDPQHLNGEVWTWEADGTLTNQLARQCLNVVNAQIVPGTPTEIWHCDLHNFPEQRWIPFTPPTRKS